MKHQWLAAALLMSGCAVVEPVSRGATLILKATVTAPRSTKLAVPAYTKDSIDHVVLQLHTLSGGIEQSKVAERSIPRQDLDKAIVFANLKAQTSYRIKAFAYATSNESELISKQDGGACFDLDILTDDAPVVSGLTLTLVDRLFNSALPLTGVAVTNGGLIPDSPERLERYLDPILNVTTIAGGVWGYTDGIGTAARFGYPNALTLDESGNIYVCDSSNHVIRKITPDRQVSVFVGTTRFAGDTDGTGTAAKLNNPQAIAYHAGMLYVADWYGNSIRKVSLDGVVQSWVGNTAQGHADGSGTEARFKNINGLVFDATGDLYVADSSNQRIRKVTPEGGVSTVAGGTMSGFRDGEAADALFNSPTGIAVDSSGTIFVADNNNHAIRKITSARVVSTLAGGTSSGYRDGTNALFNYPRSLVLSASGNLYVADYYNYRIRGIKPNGEVCTLAGNGVSTDYDAFGLNAGIPYPCGLAFDGAGVLNLAEASSYRIRKLQWINGVGF